MSAERIRAGGAGIPAFFTATGAGTQIAEGKPQQEFDGRLYVQERGLRADLAIVHAWKADTEGNLIYRKTARNFNPIMATAGEMVVVEVEHLVEPGQIDPDHIVTAGIFVNRIVKLNSVDKRIEQRTVRKRGWSITHALSTFPPSAIIVRFDRIIHAHSTFPPSAIMVKFDRIDYARAFGVPAKHDHAQ